MLCPLTWSGYVLVQITTLASSFIIVNKLYQAIAELPCIMVWKKKEFANVLQDCPKSARFASKKEDTQPKLF